MGRVNGLLLIASAAFCALVGAVTAQPAPQGRRLPSTQSDIANDFTGSATCGRCHEDEYGQWGKSLHVQMTRPAADASILGDFNRVSFADHGRAYTMEVDNGRRFISVSHGGRPPQRFEVHYTLGAKRVQGYLSRLPDGRLYVLPVFWHVAQRRWLDWKEITPVPDGDHDLRQIWNATCFNCHATSLDASFDASSRTFATTWSEMGITCEACHGPGKEHITLMEAWQSRGKPAAAADVRIFAPRQATPRQVYDTCAYCHGNKNNLFAGFLPGERLEDYALPFLVSQPMPPDDPQGDFWPDGRPSRFNRPQALTLSGCFMKGKATCTSCHVAHGSRHEHSLKVPLADSNRLCTQCHQELAAAPSLERHTHHGASSTGSRCIDCHMSDVNWRLLIRRRDHTFAAPVPELTAQYGAPNGCTTCHDGRTPEWAAAMLDRWYGDGDRRARAVRVADAFYRAGASDPSALPALASLAIDRTRGLLIRASAAEYIGQVYVAGSAAAAGRLDSTRSQTALESGARGESGGRGESGLRGQRSGVGKGSEVRGQGSGITPEVTTRVVNALIGALNDPEPTVRAAAVRSLGAIGDRRGTMAIVSRLRDDVRAVRVGAADALLWMGISTLPGAAGERLTEAQDEYVRSLEAFPDVPGNHATRGWLESERGRQAAAAHALDLALSLDPSSARAHVYRGVVHARSGAIEEAVKHWRTARSLDPAYPNIDRLLEEARRQLGR